MAVEPEYSPGELAPETGMYELLNVFGTPVGIHQHVRASTILRAAPRAFTWRRLRRGMISQPVVELEHQQEPAQRPSQGLGPGA